MEEIEKKKTKIDSLIIFILAFFLIISVSVGYAVVSTNLKINGSSNLRRNEWNIHYANLNTVTGANLVVTAPHYDSSGTIIDFKINLDNEDDLYEFTVDIVNEGTIDAKVNNLVKTGITAEQEEYLEYDLTYNDGSSINTGDLLRAGETKKVKVKVKYVKLLPIDENNLVNAREEIDLSFILDYVQA